MSQDLLADAFEKEFVAWVEQVAKVDLSVNVGTNAQSWEFPYSGHTVRFVIVGQTKNTASPPGPGIDWLLRVEEPEPTFFIERLTLHFSPADRLRRRMHDGTFRIQFKSNELIRPFTAPSTALPDVPTAHRKRALDMMIVAALTGLAGAVLEANTSPEGNVFYMLAWIAIAFGVIRFLQGATRFFSRV